MEIPNEILAEVDGRKDELLKFAAKLISFKTPNPPAKNTLPAQKWLAAEMKLPGRAWLRFDVEPDGEGSRIRQTALYDPVGLTGILYWYALYPVHHFVFAGMLRGIARMGEQRKP